MMGIDVMNDLLLRNLRRDDIPAVNLILSKSFTKARLDEGFKDSRVPPCHPTFLEMYLAGFPSGCFVVEARSEIAGFTFSRLWGHVGWIGPVSVIPALQGQKLGKRLMEKTVSALQKAGARVIGLEMIPRNYRNLGFYGKLGFVPQQLVLDMQIPVAERPGETGTSELEAIFWRLSDQQEKATIGPALDAFIRSIDPHLSLAREIELVGQFDYGDAVLMMHPQRGVIGCAVAHCETYSDEEPRNYLKVTALLLQDEEDLKLMLSFLRAWAVREELTSLVLRAPTRYHRAYRKLLDCGFRVMHADLRMTLDGYHEIASPDSFCLTKWE